MNCNKAAHVASKHHRVHQGTVCTQCCSSDFLCDSSVCGGSRLFTELSVFHPLHQALFANVCHSALFRALCSVQCSSSVQVPGSQADYILKHCFGVLVFALSSGKVPRSTQSAWEPGSQVPLVTDVCSSHCFVTAMVALQRRNPADGSGAGGEEIHLPR